MRNFTPQHLLQLVADADASAVKQQVRLTFAQLAGDPLRHRRARGFFHRRQPPQFADRFKPAKLAIELQQIAMQSHHIHLAGLLAQRINQTFTQAA